MLHPYQRHSKLCAVLQTDSSPTAAGIECHMHVFLQQRESSGIRRLHSLVLCYRSSQFSCGSSPQWSCTTRSSTPTSILDPPTTEKRHRTPPFNVYDAQLQNFKNPLFGTKASPSPQLAACTGKPCHTAMPATTDVGSPDADVTSNHASSQSDITTAVANLSQGINAVAGFGSAPCQATQD